MAGEGGGGRLLSSVLLENTYVYNRLMRHFLVWLSFINDPAEDEVADDSQCNF